MIGILLALLLAGCGEDSHVTQADVDAALGGGTVLTRQHNPYTGQGRYWIGVNKDGALLVVVHIKLKGFPVSDELRARYEAAAEETWSTDRFEVPIIIDLVWDEEDPDWTVNVVEGSGRWWTCTWWTAGRIERSVPHECGHYFGLYDEYGGGDAQGFDGGSAPGPRPPHSPGLMKNSNYPTLDYYYDGFLAWYYGTFDEVEADRLNRLTRMGGGE